MEESAAPLRRNRFPAPRALVAIEAELAAKDGRPREARHDKCHVSPSRDHGVSLVGRALQGRAGVRMNVGHHSEAALPAEVPQLAEVTTVESDYAGLEDLWVDVVLEY
jgi:hypothetical protein